MIKALTLTFALLLATSTVAVAKHRHSHSYHGTIRGSFSMTITNNCGYDHGQSLCPGSGAVPSRSTYVSTDAGEEIIPNPAGCPRRAFCGCGARMDLGIADTRLNLAWNWTRYYHGSTPVAVWSHHVAIIERFLGNHMAMLRDYNSGGHQSRRHIRSIAGARIVGGQYAMN